MVHLKDCLKNYKEFEMPDVYELIGIYTKVRWVEDDFVAIGLYRKIADEETLRFHYQLIYQARRGYVIDDSRG